LLEVLRTSVPSRWQNGEKVPRHDKKKDMTFRPGQTVWVNFKDGSVQKGKILALSPGKIFQPWANVAFSRHGILQPYLTVIFPTLAAARPAISEVQPQRSRGMQHPPHFAEDRRNRAMYSSSDASRPICIAASGWSSEMYLRRPMYGGDVTTQCTESAGSVASTAAESP